MRPFGLVLGPERTGTSAVARALSELGVCLGHALPPGDEDNPRGYFEDRAMRTPSFRLAWGDIGPPAWARALELAHANCDAELVAVKHPSLCNVPPWAMKELGPSFVAVTMRDREASVRSMIRSKHGPTEERARTIQDHRRRALVRLVRELDVMTPLEAFNMDEILEDAELEARLRALIARGGFDL